MYVHYEPKRFGEQPDGTMLPHRDVDAHDIVEVLEYVRNQIVHRCDVIEEAESLFDQFIEIYHIADIERNLPPVRAVA